MGIDIFGLEMLVGIYEKDGPLGDLLQLGRQGLYLAAGHVPTADTILNRIGIADGWSAVAGDGKLWADEALFQALGAASIASLDAGDYEGATLVHDLNEPVPVAWHATYDTVLDGGSTEHIFNVPVVLANAMQMIRVGGRYLSITAANNQLGHGFYQFSPELAYRVFTAENGFAAPDLWLTDLVVPPQLVQQVDPAALGRRNEIGITAAQTYLMVSARKVADVRPFRRWPQQSDYQAVWAKHLAE